MLTCRSDMSFSCPESPLGGQYNKLERYDGDVTVIEHMSLLF